MLGDYGTMADAAQGRLPTSPQENPSARYTFGGRVTETGLGSASVVTLTEARNRAHECRKMVASGINPVAAKRDREIAKAAQRSFGECVDAFLAKKSSEWSNAKHRRQWRQIETYAAPRLWHLPIDEDNTRLSVTF
jgi:hypothetical protein